jgi:hypothetical protein
MANHNKIELHHPGAHLESGGYDKWWLEQIQAAHPLQPHREGWVAFPFPPQSFARTAGRRNHAIT